MTKLHMKDITIIIPAHSVEEICTARLMELRDSDTYKDLYSDTFWEVLEPVISEIRAKIESECDKLG